MELYREGLKKFGGLLRANMTDAERSLWQELRRGRLHGIRFYRQKPLLDFIVDFYCPKAMLVIELDGSQHFENAHLERDRRRDRRLEALGLKVLRFNDRQVLLEREAVLAVIEEKMMARVLK